jgi:hypothetical protein
MFTLIATQHTTNTNNLTLSPTFLLPLFDKQHPHQQNLHRGEAQFNLFNPSNNYANTFKKYSTCVRSSSATLPLLASLERKLVFTMGI